MRSSDDEYSSDSDPESSLGPHIFSFAEIKRATNDFSNLVAEIDGDKFYSAKISANCYNGDVMVKHLHSSHVFREEIDFLSDCDHVNIISLVGYCGRIRMECFLVYEFMPNGTLHNHLYKNVQNSLNVEQRLEICIGVAKALSYLHSKTLVHVVNGNLSPRDIFLDDNLVPKMSRFDMSRNRRSVVGPRSYQMDLINPRQVPKMSRFDMPRNLGDGGLLTLEGPLSYRMDLINSRQERFKAVKGYLAPEHIEPGYTITCKSDVYTFGVLMLEVLCCEKSAELERTVKLALPSLIKGEIPKFASEIVKANISQECLRVWANLISDCLDIDTDKRPYINQVVDELQLALKLQKDQYGNDDANYKEASQEFSNLNNSMPVSSCHIFSISDIKRATNEFSENNFLGKGAFGSVYRGSISGNGYTGLVALKRMSINPEQGIPSFRKEIALLSDCNQVNIIRLLGYCDEEDEKILIYEFMSNGSLYDYLYQRKECTPLTVEQRLEICLGVANGLNYLHSRKDYNIIHSDIKTDNILLDANLVPKIADFGLCRTRDVGPSSSEIITNNIQGTEGYIAPECYEPNYMLSRKADVYAFGVVLLELLCERPPWKRLVTYALPYVLRGELRKFIPNYVEHNISLRCSRTCENLIRDCLDTDPNKRPSMNQVVDKLELALKMQNQNHVAKGQDI